MVDGMAGTSGSAPDARRRTLHIRCGSDITRTLAGAGFVGDVLELWDPFPIGPVVDAPDWIERRARFLARDGSTEPPYDALLAELTAADRRLAASADEYERVVIWTEHDSHDQLSALRCLAHYARTRPPRLLELISVDHYPGIERFIGLGQLPPDAMRLLWRDRVTAGAAQLMLAGNAWRAVRSADPRALVTIMRTGTPALPHLAPALRRHLQELPSRTNGLGLTQALTCQMLAERPMTINELWRSLQTALEPLPFLGDLSYLHILDDMERAAVRPFERTAADATQPFRDRLALTDDGRTMCRGERDWLGMHPPVRWVGGVRIEAPGPAWRWDEERKDVVLA